MGCTASNNARYWSFFHARTGADAARVVERVDTTGHTRRVVNVPEDLTVREGITTRSSIVHFVFPVGIECADRVPPEWRVVHFNEVQRVSAFAVINESRNSSGGRTCCFPFSAHVLKIAEDLRLHEHRPDASVACMARIGVPDRRVRSRFLRYDYFCDEPVVRVKRVARREYQTAPQRTTRLQR